MLTAFRSELCREREEHNKTRLELAETKLEAAGNRANFLNLAFGQRDPLQAENQKLRELCEMALYYYENDEIRSQIRSQLNQLTK